MIWPLVFFLFNLGGGGIYGGYAMLSDPTGHSLQMSEILPLLPISNFILPGIFLFVVMGILPFLLIYGLLVRPNWKSIDALLRRCNYHWSWTFSLGLCILLAIWLIVQGILIGFTALIQYITAINGILIFLSLLATKRYYLSQ